MGNIAPRWAEIASRCGNIGPTQSQKEERERERGGRTRARRLSRLRRKPGTRPGGQPPSREGCNGTPEVPAPVVYEGGEALHGRDRDRYRQIPRRRQRRPTHTHIGRRPAVRRKPHKSGRRPGRPWHARRAFGGNRRLYTGAPPAADPRSQNGGTPWSLPVH